MMDKIPRHKTEKYKAYMKAYREKNKDKLSKQNQARTKAWLERNPEMNKFYSLKHRYGIDLKEYNKLYDSQNGLCAICRLPETFIHNKTGKPQDLSVDHSHTSGKVRGLLCQSCNHGLGKFKDDVDICRAAANYLEKYNDNASNFR